MLALAERDDLGGMSFGFIVPKGGEAWQAARRTLTVIDLREISVVSAWPAYPDTELALRSSSNDTARAARRRKLILAEAVSWE